MFHSWQEAPDDNGALPTTKPLSSSQSPSTIARSSSSVGPAALLNTTHENLYHPCVVGTSGVGGIAHGPPQPSMPLEPDSSCLRVSPSNSNQQQRQQQLNRKSYGGGGIVPAGGGGGGGHPKERDPDTIAVWREPPAVVYPIRSSSSSSDVVALPENSTADRRLSLGRWRDPGAVLQPRATMPRPAIPAAGAALLRSLQAKVVAAGNSGGGGGGGCSGNPSSAEYSYVYCNPVQMQRQQQEQLQHHHYHHHHHHHHHHGWMGQSNITSTTSTAGVVVPPLRSSARRSPPALLPSSSDAAYCVPLYEQQQRRNQSPTQQQPSLPAPTPPPPPPPPLPSQQSSLNRPQLPPPSSSVHYQSTVVQQSQYYPHNPATRQQHHYTYNLHHNYPLASLPEDGGGDNGKEMVASSVSSLTKAPGPLRALFTKIFRKPSSAAKKNSAVGGGGVDMTQENIYEDISGLLKAGSGGGGSARVRQQLALRDTGQSPTVFGAATPIGAINGNSSSPIAHSPIAHSPIAHSPIANSPSAAGPSALSGSCTRRLRTEDKDDDDDDEEGGFTLATEWNWVAKQHDRVMRELNLSVERLIMPSQYEQQNDKKGGNKDDYGVLGHVSVAYQSADASMCNPYAIEEIPLSHRRWMGKPVEGGRGSSMMASGGPPPQQSPTPSLPSLPALPAAAERHSPTVSYGKTYGDVDSGISSSSTSGTSYTSNILYRSPNYPQQQQQQGLVGGVGGLEVSFDTYPLIPQRQPSLSSSSRKPSLSGNRWPLNSSGGTIISARANLRQTGGGGGGGGGGMRAESGPERGFSENARCPEGHSSSSGGGGYPQ